MQLELAKSWASIPGTNENPAGMRVGSIVWGMPQRVPDVGRKGRVDRGGNAESRAERHCMQVPETGLSSRAPG